MYKLSISTSAKEKNTHIQKIKQSLNDYTMGECFHRKRFNNKVFFIQKVIGTLVYSMKFRVRNDFGMKKEKS